MKTLVSNSLILLATIIFAEPLFALDPREVSNMSELKEVITSKDPLIIMFYAPWCGACKSMKEPFNEISQRFKGKAKCVKVNADNEKFREAVDYFGVEAIPTIVVKHVGVIDKEQLSQSITCLLHKVPTRPEVKEPESKQKAAPQKTAPAKKGPKKLIQKKGARSKGKRLTPKIK